MNSKCHTECHARQWITGAGFVAAAAAVIGMGTAHADDTNDALVLIPAENQLYADAANNLYLAPNGFDGTATTFLTPDQGNEVQNVAPGVQALVQAIESDYTAGDLSAADPLYVFGYSEGAVEEGLAEPQLAADGIPSDDLNFVMVGDSASAEGGYLNTVIDSLPESLQQPTTELFAEFGLTSPILGATTPDNYYPTEVYSLSEDGWANWDDGANTNGMFTEHLEYLGLTPTEIASATETTDGLTNYFTIDSAKVDDLPALYTQLLLALEISPATADAAATPAATPDDVIGQAISDLNQGATLLDAAPTADLSAQQASTLSEQVSIVSQEDPLITDIGMTQEGLSATDQTFLASADEQLVTAAQSVLSADQAFVAADQAGDLSGGGFASVDLTAFLADSELLSANFNSLADTFVAIAFPDIGSLLP